MLLLFSFGFTAIVWLMAFASVSHAMYPSHSDVIDLTPSNFNKLVIQSDEVWIVEVCLFITLYVVYYKVYITFVLYGYGIIDHQINSFKTYHSSMPLGAATAKT